MDTRWVGWDPPPPPPPPPPFSSSGGQSLPPQAARKERGTSSGIAVIVRECFIVIDLVSVPGTSDP